jgi:hypothetical protein
MGSDRGWAWCWRRAGAGEKEVRVSAVARGGRPKAAIFSWVGALW